MSFNVGDIVNYNGGVIAKVVSYNEKADRLILETKVGGAENTIHGHISTSQLTLIEAAPVEEPAVEETGKKSTDGE